MSLCGLVHGASISSLSWFMVGSCTGHRHRCRFSPGSGTWLGFFKVYGRSYGTSFWAHVGFWWGLFCGPDFCIWYAMGICVCILKGSKVVPFGQYIGIPKKKIGLT